MHSPQSTHWRSREIEAQPLIKVPCRLEPLGSSHRVMGELPRVRWSGVSALSLASCPPARRTNRHPKRHATDPISGLNSRRDPSACTTTMARRFSYSRRGIRDRALGLHGGDAPDWDVHFGGRCASEATSHTNPFLVVDSRWPAQLACPQVPHRARCSHDRSVVARPREPPSRWSSIEASRTQREKQAWQWRTTRRHPSFAPAPSRCSRAPRTPPFVAHGELSHHPSLAQRRGRGLRWKTPRGEQPKCNETAPIPRRPAGGWSPRALLMLPLEPVHREIATEALA